MSEFAVYKLVLVLCGTLSLGLAVMLYRAAPDLLKKLEVLPRERRSGFLLGMAALLWCVPLVRPIAFNWMQPLLLPAALILPCVCYFYLDYLFARSLAGLMMLLAGYLVQSAFTFHSSGTPVLAILSWIIGIAGIAVSAKPCYLRDYFRLLAGKGGIRNLSAAFFAVFGIVLLCAFLRHFRMGIEA